MISHLLLLFTSSEALTLRNCPNRFAASPTDAYDAAVRGAQYIANHIRDDGTFDYVYYPDHDVSSQHDYSWVRHAGGCYALFQIYAREKDDFMLARGRLALASLSRKMLPCQGGMCMDLNKTASIGSNGLAMMAFLAYQAATKDKSYEKMTHGLAAWILQQQRANGTFEEHFVDIETGKLGANRNPFGLGEALLAVAQLYQMEGKEEYLSAVTTGLQAAFENLSDRTVAYSSHWLGPTLRLTNDFRPQQRYFNYSTRLVSALQARLEKRPFCPAELDPKDIGSCLSPCTSSCMADGVTASWALLANAQKRKEASEALGALQPLIKYLLQSHVDPKHSKLYRNPQSALGGLIGTGPAGSQVRIDDVQHATTALLAYAEEGKLLGAC